ncbi:unnamed protein product, partial [Rotaria socialis]
MYNANVWRFHNALSSSFLDGTRGPRLASKN